MERGPLNLVSTIAELLGKKSSGFGLENRDYGRMGSVALTSPTSGVRWGTQAKEFFFLLLKMKRMKRLQCVQNFGGILKRKEISRKTLT
jgi:hypothetical protein